MYIGFKEDIKVKKTLKYLSIGLWFTKYHDYVYFDLVDL